MRLDIYLFEKSYFDSRSKAKTAIKDGRISVNGELVDKSSYDVTENDTVSVAECETYEFVGRGGNKLEHTFSVFDYFVKDKICLDIGASTGGFTECLLLHGAKRVYAVDSGRGQLAKSLCENVNVISIEGFNARNLTVDILDGNKMDVIVMDVSFISQKLLYPAILNVANKNCDVITLIKPQFEAGRQHIGKNGIVKNDKIRNAVVNDVIKFACEMGFEYINHTESPIKGGDGNIEFLLHLKVK